MADSTKPPSPKVFIIRVTDPKRDHALVGYSFVQQTAFIPAPPRGVDGPPEVRIVLDGLKQLFDKSGEYALAAVPFAAGNDPKTGSLILGANVSGANVSGDDTK